MPVNVKLSVVVPFHNVQAYAAETLRSLLLNARSDYEFILVDDCSTDRTPDVIAHHRPRLPGCVVLRHPENRGLADARNTGLDAARGRYLTFLDGDDWLAPGHLDRLVAAIERYACEFVRTDHVQVTGRKRVLHRAPEPRRHQVLDPRSGILPADRTTMTDYPYAWAGIYDRALLERGVLRFDPGLRMTEDRPWIWRLHRQARSYAVVPLDGVRYRRGLPGSLTQTGDERRLDFFRAFDLLLDQLQQDARYEELLPKAVRTYCSIMAAQLHTLDRCAPAVARRTPARAREALDRLPRAALRETLRTLPPDRAAALRALYGVRGVLNRGLASARREAVA
ncbi:glycosyltransferase family 2 protein [Streptomyces sp. NPDC059009]|uniref:glycosyltransferase family 2 protein n=1 Tax=Streptomyces sp. NPDC059009 TaxID=3346694 RepID=UPI0036A6AC1C